MKRTSLTLSLLLFTIALFAQLSPQVDSIAMRDGKKIAVDIYLPATQGPFPTILIQTPYNRQLYRISPNGIPLLGTNYANADYAMVVADWRCFFGSTSACIAQLQRGEDGYDIIGWISQQTWSDGKVGTWGPSALGKVQYQTAREQHPNHICAVPLVAGSQFKYEEYFPGGAARVEYIEQLDALGFGLSTILYQNPVYNNTWTFVENANYYPDEITIPMFMIGGWYDHNIKVMMELFEGLKTSSPVNVRDKHQLLMGPWVHGGFGPATVGSSMQGELDYPNAAGWSDSLALLFFDHYLRGMNNGWTNREAVQYYQMGTNEWRQSPEWPPTGPIPDSLYLQPDNDLLFNPPSNLGGSSTISYDPHDPSPTHGGSTLKQGLLQGPYDQSQVVESRSDALVFTSPELLYGMQVQGKIRVKLWVSSDRLDTDVAIRLTDVYPDGRSMLVQDGIYRMRFRDGYTANDTSVMVPGTVYPVIIELPDIAHTFLPGHRNRLVITGSNYPRFDANLNNGGTMYVAGGDSLVAQTTIYHNDQYLSFIELPFIVVTAIETPAALTEPQLFPNPATNEVCLDIPEEMAGKNFRAVIYNINGQVVFSNEIAFSGTHWRVPVSEFDNGMYILMLEDKNSRANWKFVVQKD